MHKKALMGIGVSLLVIFAVLMAGCVSTNDNVIVVGIDGEYPPYSYIDETGKAVGFDVESIQWIAEQKGFEVEIAPTAWDGIIPALLAGKIDMVYSGMSVTPEREAQVTFSNPYWEVNQGLVGKAGTTATVADFEEGKLVIGVQRSCSADQWMQDFFGMETYNQMVKDGKIKLYDSFPQSMVALEQGLVECVIFDDVNIETYIKGNDAFQMIGIIETGEVYAIAMRNEDTDLHALINEGLAELMASEKWEELKLKYIVE
ncbi:MAG: amino acid ABC transporter substrate-binding protein [Methanocorpusculum sp.]|nr:amino acid ABC transporter substrate-binding protein [Methanocorpusculum sp.]